MKLDGIMIWVPDVAATVDFYRRAFGFEVEMFDQEQGFAMLMTGDTTLQFASEAAAVGTGVDVRFHRPDQQPAASQLALVAEDVRAAWDQAIGAGAQVEVDLSDKPWGQTLGYLRDLNGCLVELASPAAW